MVKYYMLYIPYQSLQRLIGFKNDSPIISLYLDTSRERIAKGVHIKTFKDLAKNIKVRNEEKGKVNDSLRRIQDYLKFEFRRNDKNGLALFTSLDAKLWEVFQLPEPVPDTLIVESHPYIKPLFAVLDRYRRFCIVLIDQRKARLLELFLGEIEEIREIEGNTLHQVKTSGWKGYGEKIHHHIEESITRHFREVADALLALWRENHFDFLLLGGTEENISAFIPFLHTSLKEKIIGTLPVDYKADIHEILKLGKAVERKEKEERVEKILKRILEEKTKEGLVSVGLPSVLNALNFSAIQVLLVAEEYREEGYKCPSCGYLSLQEGDCPHCKMKMEKKVDIVEEAVETAILQDAQVEYGSKGLLKDFGITGLLRFRPPYHA
ncbi:MAG: hypothetical protein GXO71_01915 [Caldiserica bacterium]|nr:hypothetical protein [Caldisericota bacterium]